MGSRPIFSQHTFDHMRRLIYKIKDRAIKRNDGDTSAEAELLNAVLLLFVEGLIEEGSIIVEDGRAQVGSRIERKKTKSSIS
jgi:hypothetical protein